LEKSRPVRASNRDLPTGGNRPDYGVFMQGCVIVR